MRDLEDVRRALGADRISLCGASHGTPLRLAPIRLNPDRIHRAVPSGVEGPNHTWKLPAVIESHFGEVARARGARGTTDPIPLMRRVLDRLDRNPVEVSVVSAAGDTVRVALGGLDARLANRYLLGDLDNIRNLPEICGAMDEGDFSLLGRLALQIRSVSIGSAM